MVRQLLLASVFAVGVLVAPALRVSHTAAAPFAAVEVPMASPAMIVPVPQNRTGCYWTNCTQAHQNGEGDIPQGSAHYCSKQDRDGDGVACEW